MSTEPLTKVDSFQYPSAHLGHLTNSQQESLDKFKAICQERGYYHPAGKDGKKYASHDDETLLRYLRARKFETEGAFEQFKDTEDWRKENQLEQYYDQIDINDFEAARRLYPQWTGRRDKRGIPVYVFEVAHLSSSNISAYEKSMKKDKSPPINPKSKVAPNMMRLFALYENLTRFVFPLCSAVPGRPHPETPVSQSNNIVDISGVGLRQFWNLKTHMQDASTLATAHYPETLDRIFIIGAPSFFPTVWAWIKRWFDPITVSKIFILSEREMFPTLSKYIDPEHIPTKYGGSLDFTFGSMPHLDPAIISALSWPSDTPTPPTFPIGPIKWRESSTGTLEATAVGRIDGTPRSKLVASTKSDFTSLHGISRVNTAIDWKTETVAPTDGSATQPGEGDPDYGHELVKSGTQTPADAAAGQIALPMRGVPAEGDHSAAVALPASGAQPREGTSDGKVVAQEGTAAEGAMVEGTPHVVELGGGDRAAVVETATVGQARKDTGVEGVQTSGKEGAEKISDEQVKEFLRDQTLSR
ncbi:CRAL/TRIO domain-containing protein [Microthyrium microscopicum]|uniref:CRAL/TRIO domain-containing protein n=1 Tax=Microthyrium microscopicum TaxID=703497 RepID=A0A6A6U646_9PEZI|nr:CRAL/TRIO domain-containing protein [Microthyrium microscopicum]